MELEHLLHLRGVPSSPCSWTILENEVGLIILGLALTFLVSAFSVILPALKEGLLKTFLRSKPNNSTLLIKERASDITENEESW